MSTPSRSASHRSSAGTIRPSVAALVVGAIVALTACSGSSGNQAASDTTGTAAPATSAAPGSTSTAAAGAAALPDPQPGTPPSGATTAMLAEGDSIFHGLKAGGLCQTCHGPDATGTPLAPNLTDATWLTGDGTYAFIQQRVTTGMPKPTPPYSSPMLPMGGAQLTPQQIQSVAAYVYSLSHKA